MNAPEAVLQHASHHAQLLAAIAELDYVPPALMQQERYLGGLEAEAKRAAENVQLLEQKTETERKEHERLRDSTARRLAAKMTGRKDKFEAKASKEEREYVEALEKAMQAKRQSAMLQDMIAEAKTVRADLQGKAERHRHAKQDLTKLYSKVFDGPTQAYPEDDQLEYQLQRAQGRYNETQGVLNRESQALHLLQAASRALSSCYSNVQEARDDSRWDMLGGGVMTDMMERSELSAAESFAIQTATYVQQAMLASPYVKPIGQINIAHGSIIFDVIFDDIFTDMAFHDKIKDSQRNVEAVQLNLAAQINEAMGRTGAIGADLSAAADALTRARGALDGFRRSVFDSLSGTLPAYSAPASTPPDPSDAPVTMSSAPGACHPPPPSQRRRMPPPLGASFVPPPRQPGSMPAGPGATYAPPPGPPPGPPPASASPPTWGRRNPYAAAFAGGPAPARW